jgi:hypothetical protein
MASGWANLGNAIAQGKGVLTGICIILICGIISIILFVMGSANLKQKGSKWIKHTAKITNSRSYRNCRTKHARFGSTTQKCGPYSSDVEYEYEVKGQKYNGMATRMSGQKIEGSMISIEYNPENYAESKTSTSITKTLAILLIVFGVFTTLITLSTIGCMFYEDCRAGLGWWSILTGSSSNSNNNGFSNVMFGGLLPLLKNMG